MTEGDTRLYRLIKVCGSEGRVIFIAACRTYREPTRILMVKWVNILQTELMVEIYFKSSQSYW